MMNICITNISKIMFKIRLKLIEILKVAYLIRFIKVIISVLVNLQFIYFKINLILEYNNKV